MTVDRLNQLEDLFENASVGLQISTDDGEPALVNRTQRLLGPSATEALLAELPATGLVENKAVELRGADGVVRTALVNARRCERQDGRGSTYLVTRPLLSAAVPAATAAASSDAGRWTADVGPLRDVAGPIAAMSLEARAERLTTLEHFFENAPVGIHVVGPDGRVLAANSRDAALAGYAPAEYVGEHIGKVHSDQTVVETLLEQLAGGGPIVNFRAALRTRAGDLEQVVIFSSPHMSGSEFLNTRCFVFREHDPAASPTPVRAFGWPRAS